MLNIAMEVEGIQIVATKINTLVKFQWVKFLGPDCIWRVEKCMPWN